MPLYDEEIESYLSGSGVQWTRLSEPEHVEVDRQWRAIYGNAFEGRPRLREGCKAVFEFEKQNCNHYLIASFRSRVPGTPVTLDDRRTVAYDCRGPLVSLAAFHTIEFFVCPIDFSWSMVHTHEDHAFGGPYFIRREWIPENG